MIVGYIVLETGGTPVITEEFVHLFSTEKEALFSGVLSAIGNVFKEVFESKVKHIELEKHHLYFGFGKKFIAVIISDIEDQRLMEIAEEMASLIDSQDIDYVALQMDEKLQEELREKIRKLIFKYPPAIRTIEQLAKTVIAALTGIKGDKIGIERITPRVYRPSLISKLKRAFTKKQVTLNEIIEFFYRGSLKRIIEDAPNLFDDAEVGDLAKILYSKAALIMNSFDPSVQAPSLDNIKSVVESIKDEFAREFLNAEIESFLVLGAYNKRREYFISKRFEIFDILSKNDLKSEIYAILITPLPYAPLLQFLENKYRGKSDFLYGLSFEMRILLEILTGGVPESLNQVLSIVGEAQHLFEEAKKRGSPSLASYHHIIQFALVWGLFERSLTLEGGLDLLKRFWEFSMSNWEEILKKFPYQTNRHKAVNLFFMYNIIMRILLELEKYDVIGDINKIEQEIKGIIEWFIGLGKTNRIMLDMYYVSVAGMLSILSRVAAEKGRFYEDIPKLVAELAKPEMEKFWFLNEYHYAHYYADLLEALGNTALSIGIPYIKRNILVSVGYGLERLVNIFKDTPMIYYIEAMKAIRFYLLSGTPDAKNRALALANQIKEDASPFIKQLVDRIIYKYGGE